MHMTNYLIVITVRQEEDKDENVQNIGGGAMLVRQTGEL